jgi:hypothetical protein
MEKKIILILVIAVIVIIVFVFIYRYLMIPGDFQYPCRSAVFEQCSACKNLNWMETHKANKILQECGNKYFLTPGDLDWNDCSSIKQYCERIAGVT